MFLLLQNLQQLKCFDLIFVLYYAIVNLKKSSMSLFIIIKLVFCTFPYISTYTYLTVFKNNLTKKNTFF